MSHIGRKHKPEEHFRMEVNLVELPLEVLQLLKAHYVKRQEFEKAAHVRQAERAAIKTKELTDGA